ncbi:hypothetical protein BIY29_05400 [Brenneria alni]|uniref:Uncharacterized protein n=1 Tax=Brenneria alni TaxID=71656 RepID=A0A421DR67_9GAMM|nr:hypothetical protein [Brenneria alni]RLM26495.1 hypothetical protein BIY29_05400 [Brenneria alni]
MGGGGGGSSEVQETTQQKAAAEVARQQWDLYQNELKPYENLFMDKVDSLNGEQNYTDIAGDVNLGYQQAFSQARQQTADNLTSAGVDPSSGKFQSALSDIAEDQVTGTIDATARSQTDQQNKYIAGLQDAQAIGAGQKAEALQGYQGIASASQQKAISDAQSSLSKQAANQQLVGAVGGALTSYGLSDLQTSTPSSGSSGVYGGLSGNNSWNSNNYSNLKY